MPWARFPPLITAAVLTLLETELEEASDQIVDVETQFEQCTLELETLEESLAEREVAVVEAEAAVAEAEAVLAQRESDVALRENSVTAREASAPATSDSTTVRGFVDTGGGSSGSTDAYYKNCTAARDAGAAPILRGEPGYRPALDRDGDGVACE